MCCRERFESSVVMMKIYRGITDIPIQNTKCARNLVNEITHLDILVIIVSETIHV